jgi:hypothetical protein
MGFSDHLVHRLTTYRRQDDKDRFGQNKHPDPETSPEYLSDIPCRFSRPRGGETFTERSHDVVNELHVIFTMPGHDITEEDEVVVKEQDGTVILPLTNVVHVRRMTAQGPETHHLEIQVQTIRGSEH